MSHFPNASVWNDQLTSLSRQPLSFCPEFPEIADRWEAWWRFQADRPILIEAERRPGATSPEGKAFDLLDDPEAWLAVRRQQLEDTLWKGDTIPNIRVDIGPVAMAAFLGAPIHFSQRENTSWQETIIEDWQEAPTLLRFNPDNPWLQRVLTLMRRLSRDAAGHYAVCLPDMTGAIDTLANLRGPERLCMDIYDEREAIISAARLATDAWQACYALIYDTILKEGAGPVQWLTCWSNTTYTLPTCDFNALIGMEDFRQICLPSLIDQATRAGRCVFHLDGPDAARHAPTLAQTEAISAVQFTPGAGTESAIANLGMFKMFQAHGKPIVIATPRREVDEIIRALDPRGLAICVE